MNAKEYALTTTNVTPSTFGKLFSCVADGAIYAQPLWIPNLNIGDCTHNVIVAVTMRDSVYVFDADISPCRDLLEPTAYSDRRDLRQLR